MPGLKEIYLTKFANGYRKSHMFHFPRKSLERDFEPLVNVANYFCKTLTPPNIINFKIAPFVRV